MDHKEFDDIVGKKLGETQEFPFDESQWEAVAAELQGKKKRKLILWWWLGAAAGIALLIGFTYQNIKLSQKVNALENQVKNIQLPVEKPSSSSETKNVVIDEVKNETNNLNVVEKSLQEEAAQLEKTNSKRKPSANQSSDLNPKSVDYSIVNVRSLKSEKESAQKTLQSSVADGLTNQNLQQTNSNAVTLVTSIPNSNELSGSKFQTEKAQKIKRQEFAVVSFLDNKSTLLDFDYANEIPAPIASKIKTKFGPINFSAGLSTNQGWGIGNIVSSRISRKNARILLLDETFAAPLDIVTGLESRSSNSAKLWGQLHFNKGFALRMELGRKKTNFNIPNVVAYDNAISSNLDTIVSSSTIFSNAEAFAEASSAVATQTELQLGVGITYAFFRKWKVQPYLSAMPEFSFNIKRQEAFGYFDSNSEPTSESFNLETNKIQLRTLSARAGVQGVLWKHLFWNAEFGYNVPMFVFHPNLSNKYQAGVGVGYKF